MLTSHVMYEVLTSHVMYDVCGVEHGTCIIA